jgi:two-component system cell cycle sensor histidine kinase/response regulator CckA
MLYKSKARIEPISKDSRTSFQPPMTAQQRKILVIDDNPADRAVLRYHLNSVETWEYLIWEAEAVGPGLALWRETQPDCILVDYFLPDSDGLEFVNRLRQFDGLMPCAVMLLTGAGDETIAVEALKQGAHDYLVKGSMTTVGLVQRIEQAIAKARLERTVAEQRHALEQKNQELEQALHALQAAKDNLEEVVQKRTAELVSANHTLRTQALVLQNMVEGVVVTNKHGTVVFTNTAFDRMFGCASGALLNHPISALNVGSPEESRRLTQEMIQRIDASGQWRGEVYRRKQDGTAFLTSATMGKLIMAGETYYVSVQEDITERRQLERQLRERERLINIGATAARLTHEIGNRLNGLSTSIQLLERQLRKQTDSHDSPLMESVRDLHGETTRLTTFLQDLRTLAAAYQLRRQPTNIALVVQEVLHKQARRCAAVGIQVDQRLAESLPLAFVDKERLVQAVANLCENAIEAMPEGGTLTVTAATRGEWVRVEICDTGTGVAPDIDILEPFVTTKPGGTGLGLTIALLLVAVHDGTMSYTSNPGRGTTFVVELPVAAPPAQPEAIESFTVSAAAQALRRSDAGDPRSQKAS